MYITTHALHPAARKPEFTTMAKATKNVAAATTTAPAAQAPSNPLLDQRFTLDGAKVYAVRPNTAQNNAKSWDAIRACIVANGGTATRQQLLDAVKDMNHAPMVGYVIRRGWVAPVQAEAAAPQA